MNKRQREKAARPLGKFDKQRWIRRDIQNSLSYIGCFGNTLAGQVEKVVKMIQTQQVSMNSSRRGSENQRRMRNRLFRDYVKEESDVGRMISKRVEDGIASHDKEEAAGLKEASAPAAAVNRR